MDWGRQATSHNWDNVDPDLSHQMASLGHNELNLKFYDIANTMTVDGLVMQGARSSVAIVFDPVCLENSGHPKS